MMETTFIASFFVLFLCPRINCRRTATRELFVQKKW